MILSLAGALKRRCKQGAKPFQGASRLDTHQYWHGLLERFLILPLLKPAARFWPGHGITLFALWFGHERKRFLGQLQCGVALTATGEVHDEVANLVLHKPVVQGGCSMKITFGGESLA
jgi:hypothetical protein